MSLPVFPKFKKSIWHRRIPIGTRLMRLGESLRDQLSAGPIEASPAERAVYGWLVRFGIPFAFQQPLMGGRRIPGGAVVDFIIYLDYPPIIIRVMSYWHTAEIEVQLDKLQAEILAEEGFRVEDIWDWETIDYRFMSAKLELILFGNCALQARPFLKPPYVSPQPDCPWGFDDMCWNVDC